MMTGAAGRVLWLTLGLGLAAPALGMAQIDGVYVGFFGCYQKIPQRAMLQLESQRGGTRLTGVLSLYDLDDDSKVAEAVDLKGQARPSGQISLEIKKHRKGSSQERLTHSLRGQFEDPKITGGTSNYGCTFKLARTGSRDAQWVLAELKRTQSYQQMEATAPERRRARTKLHGGNQRFEYVDARLAGGWDNLEVEPVDSVSGWLNGQNLKCIKSHEVAWRGTTGTAVVRQFGRKWNVIECQGECKGLIYQWSGFNGVVTHYGLGKPVPVMEMYNESFAPRDLVWTFTYEGGGGTLPRIRIHNWTKDPGDRGPGCELFP